MARNPKDVSISTFIGIVASDNAAFDPKTLSRKELLELARKGAAYSRSVHLLFNEGDVVREATIKRGKEYIASIKGELESAVNAKKASDKVLMAIKHHYPHKYNAFVAKTLSKEERRKILTSCREFVRLGALGSVASAE